MSEVKRYDYGYRNDFNGGRDVGLIERPEGELVLHSDYDALAAECERLRAMNNRLADDGIKLADQRDAALTELAALKGGQEPNWRDHSVNYAKGEKCPQTIETLQAAWERDQELLLEQRAEIAKLKEKLNQARQKQPAQASAWVPEGDKP